MSEDGRRPRAADDYGAIRRRRDELYGAGGGGGGDNYSAELCAELDGIMAAHKVVGGSGWDTVREGRRVAAILNCKRGHQHMCFFDGDYRCIMAKECKGSENL